MKLTRKIGAGLGIALLLLGGMCLVVQETHTAHADTSLVYAVDAQTAAGGVFARFGPHTDATQQIVGDGIYPGQEVQLLCGVTDGDAIGPYNNTTWHFVKDLNNPGEGEFWVNDHYLDTPNAASQLTPGESPCPNESDNPLQSTVNQQPCTPILVIGARGSGDEYREDTSGLWGFDSTLSPLVNGLLSYYGKDNVTTYGLPYPAVSANIDTAIYGGYTLSLNDGVSELTEAITMQAQACPLQLIDLVGYSQGADVINTAIPLLPQQVRDHINGAVTFGDPQFNGQNVEDRGSYNHSVNGLKALAYGPRPELPGDMLNKSRSYCDDTDYICNISVKSLNARGSGHFAYAQTHAPEAEQFLESLTIVYVGPY